MESDRNKNQEYQKPSFQDESDQIQRPLLNTQLDALPLSLRRTISGMFHGKMFSRYTRSGDFMSTSMSF